MHKILIMFARNSKNTHLKLAVIRISLVGVIVVMKPLNKRSLEHQFVQDYHAQHVQLDISGQRDHGRRIGISQLLSKSLAQII